LNFLLLALYSIVIASPLLLTGCKEDDDGTSSAKPIVKEKNYWSKSTCNIDGKPWGDCYPSFLKESRVAGEWYKNAIDEPLRLYFINLCDSPFTDINISLNDFTGVGSYTLSTDSYAEHQIINSLTRIQYRTDITNKGTVTITKFDTLNHQVSGTFQFKAFNPDSNKTKAISNGIFNKVTFSVL
jgi:hypothetical protein